MIAPSNTYYYFYAPFGMKAGHGILQKPHIWRLHFAATLIVNVCCSLGCGFMDLVDPYGDNDDKDR